MTVASESSTTSASEFRPSRFFSRDHQWWNGRTWSTFFVVFLSLSFLLAIAWGNWQFVIVLLPLELLTVVCGFLFASPRIDLNDVEYEDVFSRIESRLAIHPATIPALILLPLLSLNADTMRFDLSREAQMFLLVGVVTLAFSLLALFFARVRQYPPALQISRAFGGGVYRLHVQPHAWLGVLAIISLSFWLSMAYGLNSDNTGSRNQNQPSLEDPSDSDTSHLPTSPNRPKPCDEPADELISLVEFGDLFPWGSCLWERTDAV